MGAILPLVRPWALPLGSLTLTVGLNVLFVSFLNDQQRLLPAALVAGLVADLLVRWLRPASDARGFASFAVAVPVILYLLYFATLLATDQVIWPGALVVGSIVLAGIVGALVALVTATGSADSTAAGRDRLRRQAP